jgi:hypothetical protein
MKDSRAEIMQRAERVERMVLTKINFLAEIRDDSTSMY